VDVVDVRPSSKCTVKFVNVVACTFLKQSSENVIGWLLLLAGFVCVKFLVPSLFGKLQMRTSLMVLVASVAYAMPFWFTMIDDSWDSTSVASAASPARSSSPDLHQADEHWEMSKLWTRFTSSLWSSDEEYPRPSSWRERLHQQAPRRRHPTLAELNSDLDSDDILWELIIRVLPNMPDNEVVVKTAYDDVTAEELKFLLGREAITDSVMNSYMQLMTAVEAGEEQHDVYYMAPTVWKFLRQQYDQREPMTEQEANVFRDVFEKHKDVVIIHHQGHHWAVLHYNKADNYLELLDSWQEGLTEEELDETARNFYHIFKPLSSEMRRSAVQYGVAAVPQQEMLDCGVYAVMSAERVWRQLPLSGYDIDIVMARRHIARVLLNNKYEPFQFSHQHERYTEVPVAKAV
jgi:hypothetical protein